MTTAASVAWVYLLNRGSARSDPRSGIEPTLSEVGLLIISDEKRAIIQSVGS